LVLTAIKTRRKYLKPAVARAFIESVIPRDQIFTVTFIRKSDGGERTMNCRRGVNTGLVGTGRQANSNAITVFDLKIEAYRSFNLDRILSIKGAGATLTAS
jgi:hypothetical protein